MQIFAEMPPDPPEEIFVGCAHRTTPLVRTLRRAIRDGLKILWFLFSLFPVGQRKPRKFAPHENFPLYGSYAYGMMCTHGYGIANDLFNVVAADTVTGTWLYLIQSLLCASILFVC